jgi:hypothetical protein
VPAASLPLLGEKVPPPPGENTDAAKAVGVLEPKLNPEPGNDEVEAKRFEMFVLARRKGSEAIDDEGEDARCRPRICEDDRSAYCGWAAWGLLVASCGGFMLWPPRAGVQVTSAEVAEMVLHESRRMWVKADVLSRHECLCTERCIPGGCVTSELC